MASIYIAAKHYFRLMFFFLINIFFILAAAGLEHSAYGQADSVTTATKTENIRPKHSPRTAVLLSAVIPGAGQAYNKKYWKIPIVYAGFGALYYLTAYNNNNYELFRDAYAYSQLDGPIVRYEGALSSDNLLVYKKKFKRSRDRNILMFAGFYLINILDATVDAHMFDFDVSDETVLRIEPTLIDNQWARGSAIPALRCCLTF